MRNFIMMDKIRWVLAVIALGCLTLLQGCGESTPEVIAAPAAVIIHDGEECDLCGMLINNFSGPKGQLFERGSDQPKRFCSTRDLMAYALQPEHQHRINHIYVHDVPTAPWDKQEDAVYIDAKTAFFVTGHSQTGAMGPTLATFSSKVDAEKFTADFGGKVVTFDQIDMAVLNEMNHQSMGGMQMSPVEMDHSEMDHSAMDHSGMSHTGMDHSAMDHSATNHSTVEHDEMPSTDVNDVKMNHQGMDHSRMGH